MGHAFFTRLKDTVIERSRTNSYLRQPGAYGVYYSQVHKLEFMEAE